MNRISLNLNEIELVLEAGFDKKIEICLDDFYEKQSITAYLDIDDAKRLNFFLTEMINKFENQ